MNLTWRGVGDDSITAGCYAQDALGNLSVINDSILHISPQTPNPESQAVKPSLRRITVTLKDFGQRPSNGASILVDRTRSKKLVHTSQNRPSFCAFYWVTTFSSAKRVSGWPRERNLGGVTGELRRLGLNVNANS